MKKKTVQYLKHNTIILIILCMICMVSLCACGNPQTEECILQVYADAALKKELPLVGDKFLVMDGKGYDIQYYFGTAENLLEKIKAGEACDLLITSSDSLRQQPEENGVIAADKSIELLKIPLAIITSAEHPSLPFDPEGLFYQAEYTEDEEYSEEVEGYRRYLDVLWEITEEEQWQDDWNERFADLWVSDNIRTIGILTSEEIEGKLAKDILNQDGQTFELLDLIGRVRTYSSNDALLEAVRTGDVHIGICSLANAFDEKKLQIQKVYYDPAPMVPVYVSTISHSENRKEAKELAAFLQGNHARRFFEDFGFYFVR